MRVEEITIGTADPSRSAENATAQILLIAFIPSIQFVTSVAGQHNGYTLASQTRNVIGRKDRGVSERLLQHPRQLFECLAEIWIYNEFVVLGAKTLGDRSGVRNLAEVLVRKPDREGFHRPGTGASHQGYDCRRI